jgi:RNA polymerase sigma-70 factor (ECF subfamily)
VQDDSLWIDQLRRGDLEGLRCIYDRYSIDLFRIAACLLADPVDAEDCVHDVFVTLATSAARLNLDGNLKGYLVTCIVHRVRAWQTRDPRRSGLSLANVQDFLDCRTPDAADLAADREQAASLYKALAALPYEQREVITLHLHGQETFQEIAERQGLSINTIQSRYRYGLEKLRVALATEAQK